MTPSLALSRRTTPSVGWASPATLLSYVDDQQNITFIAARIDVYASSVYQRWMAIEILLSRWNNSASRTLKIHMALRL